MLNKIKLYGRLARFIGERTFEAEVKTPAQAFKFLLANFPKLEKHMLQQNYCVKVGDCDIDEEGLGHPIGIQEIKIIPVKKKTENIKFLIIIIKSYTNSVCFCLFLITIIFDPFINSSAGLGLKL